MKRLLLFVFTVAFLSLLSNSAFAQWGSTVSVSNDTEYLKAMQDNSVQNIILSEGYYTNIERKIENGEIMVKNQPKKGGSSRAPLLDCTYGTVAVANQCYDPLGSITITLTASAVGTECSAVSASWICVSAMSAEIGGTPVAMPTITPVSTFISTATGFVEGGVYFFLFEFVDGTQLYTPFRVWGQPHAELGANQNACMNTLPKQLSVTSSTYYGPGLPNPQKNGVLSYLWSVSPGATITNPTSATPSFSTATTGTYTVTVVVTESVATYNYGVPPTTVPAHSCSVSDSYTITVDASPSATISSQTNVACFGGSTGAATVLATGGTTPYSYSWNTSPVQTTATATGLVAGTYTATVSSPNGCSTTATAIITQPPSGLTVSTSQVNVLCRGNSTGSATAIPAGGTGTYTYLWSTSPAQTTATATGLAAGTYSVTVSDGNQCPASASVTITQPATALGATTSQVNVLCRGNNTGSASVTASGGTGAYSYSWNTSPAQTTASILNLVAGTYTVTVSDANACSVTRTVTITQPAVALSATTTQVNVACRNNSTGSATVTAAGGTGAYSYSWNTSPAQTTATASNLAAGTYTVTVTDINLCTTTATVTITQPSVALSATTSKVNVLCFGNSTGTATAIPAGGTGSYSYSWNTSPVQTTITATGLAAGTYTVTVTDANLCTTSASATITQPASALGATTTQVNVLCRGNNTGSATVSVTGGTGAYSYSWNTSPVQTTATASNLVAGTYTVTVYDANECSLTRTVTITQPAVALSATTTQVNVACRNNSTGSATVTASGGTGAYSYSWNTSPVQTTATASNLVAGTYTVTVTDANLCTATASVTITQPSVGLSATTSKVDVLCFGNSTGTATAIPAGGTGSYSYSWNTSPVQSTATASGLAAGTYTVTVTDANLCTTTASATITQPAAALSASTSQINVLCFGAATGTATVTVSGGTGTITYSWNTDPVQTTATVSNLAAGTYTVTVTDANQCSLTRTVTITQPAEELSVTTTHVDVLCYGNLTGTATAIPAGGTIPYSYSWITSPAQTTATATGLGAGNYMVFVTDGNGCSSSASAIISQPQTALYVGIEGSNVNCFGGSDGSATAFANGGTGTSTYSWNTVPIQTTAGITGLVAGTYTVTVTDANLCTATNSVTITQPLAPLSASTTQVNIDCYGAATGTISLTVTGGTPCTQTGPSAPAISYYLYSWTGPNGFTSSLEDLSGLVAGTYTVTVTDCNQCTTSATVVLTQQPDFSVTCHGNVVVCQMAQTFNLIDLGGFGSVPTMSGTYTFYEYSPTNTFTTFNPGTAGTGVHTITYQFTNQLGCVRTCNFEITVDPMGEVDLEGQVKYWNATETYMPTPFPTDEYGTQPPDYFYVALHYAQTEINQDNPLLNSVDWQKVDIVQEENNAGVIIKDFMSYFKFDTKLQANTSYRIIVWDGSGLWQEYQILGTQTGISTYVHELGASYTWNNWAGVTGTDALGIQYMINGATDINSAPYGWNWIDEPSITTPLADDNYGYYSFSIANVNSSLNGITALDRLTTQYRIAGLQPAFPNNTPNFRVAGRFVNTLPKITWPEPFNENQKPVDVEFTKSSAVYQYFTPAIEHYYASNSFTTQPFFLTQNTGPVGACPDFGYINIYYEATGDVNASNVPVSANFKATAPVLQYENEIAVQKGEIIDIPVSIDRSAELGSIAVGLTFRNDLIKVLEVPGFEVVNIDNEKGLVRVVWADPNGKNVSTDEALFTVKALVLADITSDNRLFELEAMTELGSVNAQPIVDINLKTVAISTKSVVNSEMFVANYPNPFNNKTTISYNLPEAGSVKILVYNKLGAEITTLVNQYQTEGTHLVDLNRGDLSAGVYYYKLVLQGTKDTYSATRNMVITE